MQFKDIPLRTRRALSLYKVYGDNAFLVLNGILSVLMPFWLSADNIALVETTKDSILRKESPLQDCRLAFLQSPDLCNELQ